MTPAIVCRRFEPQVSPDGSMHWKLQRNCAMTPGQLMAGLAIVMLPSVLVGAGFFIHGIPWVAFFSGVEVLIFAFAFVAYARCAGDAEWIRVSDEKVEVQVRTGSEMVHHHFNRAFLRMHINRNAGDLLSLQESGRSVTLGHHIPRHLRTEFCRAIRTSCGLATPASSV